MGDFFNAIISFFTSGGGYEESKKSSPEPNGAKGGDQNRKSGSPGPEKEEKDVENIPAPRGERKNETPGPQGEGSVPPHGSPPPHGDGMGAMDKGGMDKSGMGMDGMDKSGMGMDGNNGERKKESPGPEGEGSFPPHGSPPPHGDGMGMKEGGGKGQGKVEKFMLPSTHGGKFKYSSMRNAYSFYA